MEVSPAAIQRINLTQSWFKVKLRDESEASHDFITNFPNNKSSIRADFFSTYEVHLSTFMRFFPLFPVESVVYRIRKIEVFANLLSIVHGPTGGSPWW